MAIQLIAVIIKHERRLRLTFNDVLAAGAFGSSTSTLTLYAVTSQDALGTSPAVTESIVVASDAKSLEIALGDDLVPGARYNISAIGVPSVAGPVTDSTSQKVIAFSVSQTTQNAEPVVNEQELLLYGRDVIWNGLDYQENAQGDLDVVDGVANVVQAIQRRCFASGLPWDATYGPYAETYVNSATAANLRGAIIQQILQDNRVRSVSVDVTKSADGTGSIFLVTPVLIGEDPVGAIPIET